MFRVMAEAHMIPKKSAEAFVSGVEAILMENGFKHPYEMGERLFQWLVRNPEAVAAIRSHEALTHFLESQEDDAERFLRPVLALMRMVPMIVEKEVARVVQRSLREHPIKISPGHPKAVEDDAVKRQICDSVSDLYRKGIGLTDAQQRIADRYGISPRSVQRYWSQRQIFGENKPESIRDLLAEILKM
jgi:hypothetical protein